ncbi:MAG: LacI family transcriptional regulator [Rhodospirillales bacterium]|nr:LacI family transcriptional regulator [Rhodospirillales bacterium]
MPRRKMTLKEIARRLGVSTATVSNALSGRGRISEKRATEIRLFAESMGYVPSHAAKSLRTGSSSLVGLVIPNITNPIFPSLAQSIENELYARGYAVLLADSHNEEDRQSVALRHLAERGAESVIVIPCHGTDVPDLNIPVVVIDTGDTPGNGVASDHRSGGQMVANHLLNLGHRNVLILAGPESSRVAGLRTAGFRNIFEVRDDVTVTIHHSPYGLEEGSAAIRRGFASSMTAVAAASDTLAIGAITALSQAGYRIPDDVAVTGFDDIVWARLVTPELTSVRQEVDAIAAAAVSVAFGEKPPGRVIPVRLIERASTVGADARSGATDPHTTAISV